MYQVTSKLMIIIYQLWGGVDISKYLTVQIPIDKSLRGKFDSHKIQIFYSFQFPQINKPLRPCRRSFADISGKNQNCENNSL